MTIKQLEQEMVTLSIDSVTIKKTHIDLKSEYTDDVLVGSMVDCKKTTEIYTIDDSQISKLEMRMGLDSKSNYAYEETIIHESEQLWQALYRERFVPNVHFTHLLVVVTDQQHISGNDNNYTLVDGVIHPFDWDAFRLLLTKELNQKESPCS